MRPLQTSLSFSLPAWAAAHCAGVDAIAQSAGRMRFVLAAARLNMEHRTGGPFAAAVFERESGVLVSLGVNLVTTCGNSTLHAEMVALALAQRRLGTYDLGAPGLPAHDLVTSTEPCAMCLGAIPWSGIRRVTCGAGDADARAIGFDEGAKPADWRHLLEERGIEVVSDLLAAEARAVLDAYAGTGGRIYNPTR